MITTNVIHRTFHIRYGNLTGTTFTIDRDNKQYLVTARHVVKDIKTGSSIAIFHDKQWKSTTVEVVGIGAGEIDVVVLTCPVRLAPLLPLKASSGGLAYGQTVYFLGFPFGWDGGGENINLDFPMPFVKAGIVSSITFGDSSRIYVDGHNNRGFSGGPVVFAPHGQKQAQLQVAGVVSSYPSSWQPILNKRGVPILSDNDEPLAYFQENTGFVVAFNIRHATEMIDVNPIGFLLLTGQDN